MKKILLLLKKVQLNLRLYFLQYKADKCMSDVKTLDKDIQHISNEVSSLDPEELAEMVRVMCMDETELAIYERQAFNHNIRQRVEYFFRHGEFPNGWKIIARHIVWLIGFLFCITIGFGALIVTIHEPTCFGAMFVADIYLALAAMLLSMICKNTAPAHCWLLIAATLMCHLLSSLFLSI